MSEMDAIKCAIRDVLDERANAPWWCGFDPRSWPVKGLLDWMVPTVAAVVVAYAAPQIQTKVDAAL